jgi:hypothetical protein
MRDLDTIDAELRLPAAVRRTIREHGVEPSSRRIDDRPGDREGHYLADLGSSAARRICG